MALKVHMMGPRSNKFPFKAQGSWYVKLDNKIHQLLLTRMCKENLNLEDALLRTLMDGIKIMTEKHNEPVGPEQTD